MTRYGKRVTRPCSKCGQPFSAIGAQRICGRCADLEEGAF